MPKLLSVLLGVLVIASSCQRELDDHIDPTDPIIHIALENLPKKIIEVGTNGDSAICIIDYDKNSRRSKMDVSWYYGATFLYQATYTYSRFSDGRVGVVVHDWHDLTTGNLGTIHIGFIWENNRIEGLRNVTSGFEPYYQKYSYDAKGRLSLLYNDMDSVSYFTKAYEAVGPTDSLVYDDNTEALKTIFYGGNQRSTGLFQTTFSSTISQYDNRPNYMRGGLEDFFLFGSCITVPQNNAVRMSYKGFDSNGSLQRACDVTCNITYDDLNRPIRMDYIILGPQSNPDTGPFLGATKTKYIYY